ncbi:hydroxyacylglutathione hydrolase [Alphaproteobacteria bacterium]|nr:hydroxyacylglutathione hydrolase [Alphaproteobacteria bacterium]MDB2522785.1 hydroxyacylglutathione hydrolase [Alphaproteobacteria bacterium]
MAALEIYQFPCLSDNYGFLVHDSESGETACIDTPETAPILAALEKTGWTLTQIWNTHHHYDHAGNNEEIKRITGCTITGPAGEADKIPAIDRAVDDGDTVMLGAHEAHVLNVGGHTLGHIAFHMEGHAFVGDSLFALGCGRVFEGTMAQMWESLQKLNALPDGTQIYCAHEYTTSNAAFAVTIDPDNEALSQRVAEISALRAANKPTVPTEIALERATNPFLRATDANVQARLNMSGAPTVDVFAEIRARKDSF